jgi:hypothetical protein
MGKLTAKLTVEIPLTVKELADFEMLLEKSGMTAGDYVRRVIAGESVFRLAEQARAKRLAEQRNEESGHGCRCGEAGFPLGARTN